MKGPIRAINPLLGDESFVAAFGRLPEPTDDPTIRVATHLAHVIAKLRARGKSGPVLDALDAYTAAAVFPASEAPWGMLPSFVDPCSGARCAVAHLVETTAGTALVEALDRDHHDAFISVFAEDPRFIAWADTSGLTLEELAWIQPSYSSVPLPSIDPDIRVDVAAEIATAAPQPDGLPHGFTLAHAGASYRSHHGADDAFYNVRVLALEGAIGETNGDHELAFAAHARIGQELRFWGQVNTDGDIAGWTIGAGVDRFGEGLPAAWTFPATGYWTRYVCTAARVGVHGSLVLAPGGFGLADRAWLGGSVGLELTTQPIGSHIGLTLSADATRIGDTSFFGVTLGFLVAHAPVNGSFDLGE